MQNSYKEIIFSFINLNYQSLLEEVETYSPLFFVPTATTKKDWEGTHHIFLLYFLSSSLKTGFHSG